MRHFEKFEDGIDFYANVQQLQRVFRNIENCHYKALDSDCNKAKFNESLEYYLKEKAIILAKLQNLLSRTKEGWQTPRTKIPEKEA